MTAVSFPAVASAAFLVFPLPACVVSARPVPARKPLVIGANSVQVVFLKILEVKQGIMRGFVRANEFVKLDMHCLSVPVLRVLNKKNHQEGNDGCPGVYNELPGIAEAE